MKIICEINTFKSGLMALIFMLPTFNSNAATALADKPIFSGANVPGNVALALSVEYPTAITRSYKANTYSLGETFKGYFDSEKCYTYAKYAAADTLTSPHYFVPSSQAVGHDCKGVAWSGNFLNFATTQTIDPFRQALTGGFRRVDTVNTTVLEKAYASADDPGLAPITTIKESLVSKSTPYNWSSFSLRIYGLGHRMWYTNNGNLLATVTDADKPGDVSDRVVDPKDGTKVYEKYVRNQVCVSDLLESNCVAYGTNFKPEGLIQKNAMKLRFAAFGYLKETGTARNGGVLRARMASLGPNRPVPNAPDEPNIDGGSYKGEWNKDTGQFIKNPAPLDAANSGITAPGSGIGYSGVINYLNNFGVDGGGYKFNDPVSELYYAVTRYYKGQGNLADYTNNLNDSNKDGFPVITNWNEDPIKYSCQANFILGVGDIRTHADSDLPGSTIGGNKNPVDTTVNVLDATNRVGDIEKAEAADFLTPLGTRRPNTLIQPDGKNNCCGGNSYFMAGLAYDIHTKDIRDKMDETQTVSTYWLDVLEGGYIAKNQFWLAAKYGGFTDIPKDFKPYEGKAKALLPTQWEGKDDNGIPNGIPNNYFKADKPQTMIDGLGKAFNDILIKTNGSASAFAVISPDVANDDFSYATSYTVDGWFGDVIGSKIIVKDGIASASIPPKWKASDIGNLEGQDWDTGRFIASANCVADDTSAGTQKCTGAEFRLAKMSTENVNNLGTSNQQDMLNYLRGNRTNSIGVASNVYRPKILGDIVNSKIFPVGAPRANYSDEFNPGYSQFKKDYSGRLKVVYVGANDGMLHAIDGGPEGGKEIFAYVPQALFAGPTSTPVDDGDDGLLALAKIPYIHRYYVDASPVVTDVNFGGSTTDWHSLLVGGLGKGGKSYYAIDVTNPNNLSNEPNLAKAVKWEFKHKYMGYAYGRPLMLKVRTENGGSKWVVVLTSGYNNVDGKGHFFIINPSDGNLIQDISTGEGSPTNDAGLAHVTAFVSDSRDFAADALYAGDLLGNVWRVNLSGKLGEYAAPVKLATLATSSGVPQSITTPPVVEFDQSTLKRFVFIGTGRLLDNTDVTSTQEQTFYAINDGTQSAFFTSSTSPSAFPFNRSTMVNDNTVDGLLTNLADNKTGYYKDLGFGSNGVGYRVNVEMRSSAGVIAFIANLTGGDSCNPSGSSRTYALTYGTGKSVLSSDSKLTQYVENLKGLGTSVTVYNAAPYDGGVKIVVSDDKGNNTTSAANSPDTGGFKQLNWREIPNAN